MDLSIFTVGRGRVDIGSVPIADHSGLDTFSEYNIDASIVSEVTLPAAGCLFVCLFDTALLGLETWQ